MICHSTYEICTVAIHVSSSATTSDSTSGQKPYNHSRALNNPHAHNNEPIVMRLACVSGDTPRRTVASCCFVMARQNETQLAKVLCHNN